MNEDIDCMPHISIMNGPTFEADANTRLVNAIEDHGVDILHRCGGHARCTTCRVTFLAGEPMQMTQAEYDKLKERELFNQFRLSCQILCTQDMTVVVGNRLAESGLADAGGRPEAHVTPDPVWIDKPNE